MANKKPMANKQPLTAYERLRLLTIQQNHKKLLDLGVKNVPQSFTSLAEGKKKKKKKANPTYSNTIDVDYEPEVGEVGDDSGEDYPEAATSHQVAKKQHRPRYIAPMSMNKIANLAKQRRLHAPKVLDPDITRGNRSKLTMGELISPNKGKRKKEVSNQNLAKPTSIKHGSQKRLVLVDEDDDTFQDMEPTSEDDGNEGHIMRSQGYVDQDGEYDDMDLIASANNGDEIQGDDSHDDLEDVDEALVQDQLHGPELEKEIEISKTNKRGPTMLHHVHTRKFDEREIIICNKFGQPVGPEEKDVVDKFTRFLGTIARNHSYAPLTYSYGIRCHIKIKYGSMSWLLETPIRYTNVGSRKKHFNAYKDNKTRLMNRPKNIPVDDFSQLLRLWNNEEVEKRCLRAKEIRMSQKNMHRAGPKSFARIREEMTNEDPNKELPSLTKVFERTRKRTEGRAYLDTYDDTATKIEQMKNYKPTEDGSASVDPVDPFTAVMNKEYNGYLRLYGRGVTKTTMKKMDGGEEPYMIPGGLMESFKADIEVEKTQLLEMRKEIEEDHQRKKAELEAMQKDIDSQQANFEATMRSMMKKLPMGVLQDLRDE